MTLLRSELRTLLDDVASPAPTPGSGAVAGIVIALSAGLVASAARRSASGWDEARAVAAQAQALRARVEKLAEANANAYLEALALIEGSAGDGGRDEALGQALETAAELPLALAEAAYDVVLLAAEAAAHAAPHDEDDAAAAAILAEAAARALAGLVAVNLCSRPDDERVIQAEHLAAAATAAARTVAK